MFKNKFIKLSVFNVKAKEIMRTNVQSIHENETVHDAAEKMSYYKISCLLVYEHGKPIGIVTERDMLKKVVLKNLDPKQVTVREIMAVNVLSKNSSTTVAELESVMEKFSFRHIPIIDDNKLVGIVTETDLNKSLYGYLNYRLFRHYIAFLVLIVIIVVLLFLI